MMRDDVYDEEASGVGVVLGFTDEAKDPNGYYARLEEGNEIDAATDVTHIKRSVESISSSISSSSSSSSSSFGESARYGSGNCSLLMYIWWWAKLVLLVAALAILGAIFLKWVGPFIMDKGLLERYPKSAALIRLAGEGNGFDQFRVVSLIRILPFPYIIFNYCAVATGVDYLPYLLGSHAGMVPEIFLTLYTWSYCSTDTIRKKEAKRVEEGRRDVT